MLSAFALAGLSMLEGSRVARATVVRVVAGVHDPDDDHDDHDALDDQDEDCERVTTTGRAEVRRRCDGTRTEAAVDNRITIPAPRAARTTHERPIDRLRSR